MRSGRQSIRSDHHPSVDSLCSRRHFTNGDPPGAGGDMSNRERIVWRDLHLTARPALDRRGRWACHLILGDSSSVRSAVLGGPGRPPRGGGGGGPAPPPPRASPAARAPPPPPPPPLGAPRLPRSPRACGR